MQRFFFHRAGYRGCFRGASKETPPGNKFLADRKSPGIDSPAGSMPGDRKRKRLFAERKKEGRRNSAAIAGVTIPTRGPAGQLALLGTKIPGDQEEPIPPPGMAAINMTTAGSAGRGNGEEIKRCKGSLVLTYFLTTACDAAGRRRVYFYPDDVGVRESGAGECRSPGSGPCTCKGCPELKLASKMSGGCTSHVSGRWIRPQTPYTVHNALIEGKVKGQLRVVQRE
ncbi:hypothetical protein Bbelb_171150 [Branchiostoma belcheri]|nr:hypothetical protein Bbelb_171150 [Branchiostoma belcheri]